MRLHTNTFTHKRFYTLTLLHTDAFTHRRFHTQTRLHTVFDDRTSFRAKGCAGQVKSQFYHFVRKGCKSQFYLSFRHSNLVSCKKVAPDDLNGNFTSVFGDQSSFRAKGLRRTSWNRNFTSILIHVALFGVVVFLIWGSQSTAAFQPWEGDFASGVPDM